MDIRNIPSVQRVVNFTPNNGKMLRAEQPQSIMPGVTMICDLPLLFMNGLPTCLENLSLDQLEKFVPYMINCSGASQRMKPKWWPHDLDFSITPVRKTNESDSEWRLSLQNLVLNCYSYHGCRYALRLCAKNSHDCHYEWTLVDGLDGTMYLYNKVTRKISTTFESANIIGSRRKLTFLNNTLANENANCVPIRRNKPPVEIYLCDMCDAEFRSLKEMQIHEKGCSQKRSWSDDQTQENITEMYKIGVSNNRAQKCDLKIQTVSTLDQPPCLSRHLKNQTGRKVLKLADHNKSQEIYSHVHKICENDFDSCEEMQPYETHNLKNVVSNSPLTQRSCQFSFNSRSFNCDNELSTPNTLPKSGASLMKSPLRRKRRSLFPRKLCQEELPKKKSCTNIYLYDKCDVELSSCSDVQRHETYCKDRTKTTSSPIVCTSEADVIQECFLKYFSLSSSSLSKPCPTSPGKAWFGNPMRYSSIAISSPLGNLIHGRSQLPTAAISSKMEKVERYCSAKPGEVFIPFGTKQNTNNWKVSWKSRQTTNPNHTYLFPTQRWWEMPMIRKMKMKKEKKERFLRICKLMQVSLRKMSDEEVQNYSSCRRLSVQVKKLTLEEIHYHTNMHATKTPILKKLLTEELVVHKTKNTISPNMEKLSLQKTDKYTKPMKTLSDVTHQITNAGLISVNFKDNSSSKTMFGVRMKQNNNAYKATNVRKRKYCDKLITSAVEYL